MKKIDRFLVKSFIGPFILTFFIVIFVLAMQFLWLYIDELVGKGLGLGVIFEFMAWASCTLIPMALPLATLLASIMTLGGMGEKNELLAMKAAGIPLFRILVPLIVLSVGISVGAVFAANNLIPVAYNKIYTLHADIMNTKEEIKIPTGTFYEGIEGYSLRISDRNDESKMMYDLIIYDHTRNNGNVNMTLADSGSMRITPDKRNLIFDLYHGCSYQEDNTMNYRDTAITLNRLKFDDQQLIVSLENYSFTRSTEDEFGDEIMSQNLEQLKHEKDSLALEFDTLFNIQRKRFTNAVGFQFLYQLDPEMAEQMKGSIDIDSLKCRLSEQDEYESVRTALEEIPMAVELSESFAREDYRYVDHVRRIDIECFRKFTLSLACLIFFFIGAPIGAIIRKGGFGTPVIISIFFFLIYYIVDISGKRLATEGSITPFVGTFVSTAVLLPIGVFLTIKSTQDSSLFNFDSYKTLFKNVKDAIARFYHKVRNWFRKGHGRVRIVFMGTPEFAVGPLAALLENGFDVAAVVTVPDKPSGRGLKVNESEVKQFAVAHNLPVLQPVSLKDPQFLEELRSYNANLFVVVAFRMLPKEVWTMPALGTFNLHASLLPQYRGAAPINWAIINGERVTGVTTFMIDEKIDTGRILFQESCMIDDFDNIGTLYDKLMKMGSALVVKTVCAIRDHTTKPLEQDTSHITLRPAPKITKETCHIDWSRSAREIWNLVRGLSPYPVAWSTFVRTDEESGQETAVNVKIYDSFIVNGDDSRRPGTITSDGKSYLEVQCGSGALRVTELQLAGKKHMEIGPFLLGFREPEKNRLV